MALIKCSECGKEISNKAKACPNCGNPINDDSNLPRKKVVIRSRISLALRTSVSIDNLSVGEIGVGSKKEIELELPVGTHYIGVETIVKHGSNYQLLVNGMPETVATSSAKDGKQFSVNEEDELIEIEILSKGSFQNSSGRCIVGEIIKHNKEEAEEIEKKKQELINAAKEKKEKQEKKKEEIKNKILGFINKYKIVIIVIVVFLIAICLVIIHDKNEKIMDAFVGEYEGYIIKKNSRNLCVKIIMKKDRSFVYSYGSGNCSSESVYNQTVTTNYYKPETSYGGDPLIHSKMFGSEYFCSLYEDEDLHCQSIFTDDKIEAKKVGN